VVGSTRFVLVIALVGCGFDSSGVSGSASGSGDTTGDRGTTGDPPPTTTASTSATTTTSASTTDDTTLTTSMSSTTSVDTSTTASDTGETAPPTESSGEDDTTATGPVDPEVCDGVDNDSDGGIDEGSGLNAACGDCTFVLSSTGEYWFSICSAPQNWDDARMRCAQFAGDLAKIENDTDQLTLLALVFEDHWMGIGDRDVEGMWVWVDGAVAINAGVVSGYDGWGAGQPDGGLVENCAELDPGQLGWADSPCDQMQPIVCRHPA
jgi:hypothetical protein